ncbi:MAG TPA: hypothetical protein PLA43_15190 [Bryobacteraceae bacterium]|nr:hypothetical protein [Bryobacteraceae bacterium]HOL70675.1 hypothetical protein [Bryobacteraceae bacterium]HOQ45885.1 hypothetical protein [Bryobacteraceae bacterium]HPQ14522.1 hypothetical protein [Bryobacteraceae bacterium]HPU73296.1 hypothetical protein [Bryobacteraceae bacterium]
MAGRGRTSFQKRQKEQLRLERRQAKAARKQERKLQKQINPESDIVENPYQDEFVVDDQDDFLTVRPRDMQDRL